MKTHGLVTLKRNVSLCSFGLTRFALFIKRSVDL